MGDRSWGKITIHIPATGMPSGRRRMALELGHELDADEEPLLEYLKDDPDLKDVLLHGGRFIFEQSDVDGGSPEGRDIHGWLELFWPGLDADHRWNECSGCYDAGRVSLRGGKSFDVSTMDGEASIKLSELRRALKEKKTLAQIVRGLNVRGPKYKVPNREVHITKG